MKQITKSLALAAMAMTWSANTPTSDVGPIAVLPFEVMAEPNTPCPHAGAVEDAVSTALAQVPDVVTVERSMIDPILEEHGRSMTACFDERTAPRLGRLVCAKAVIVGSVSFQERPHRVRINARLVMLETGRIVSGACADLSPDGASIHQTARSLVAQLLDPIGLSVPASWETRPPAMVAQEPDRGMPFLLRLRVADALLHDHRVDDACVWYRRAQEVAETHEQHGAALLGLSSALVSTGSAVAATQTCSRAVTLLRLSGKQRSVAIGLVGLASVLTKTGRHADARSALMEAIAIRERVKDSRGLAAAHLNAGNACFRLGDVADAAAHYRSAVAAAKATGDRRIVAQALLSLAITEKANGNISSANALLAQVKHEYRDEQTARTLRLGR